MAKRTWRDTAKPLALDNGERVIIALLVQALIAVGLFLWATEPGADMLTRLLTAGAPFALFPALFMWKWISLPPRLAAEDTIPAHLVPLDMALWRGATIAGEALHKPNHNGNELLFSHINPREDFKEGEEYRWNTFRLIYRGAGAHGHTSLMGRTESRIMQARFEVVGGYDLYVNLKRQH